MSWSEIGTVVALVLMLGLALLLIMAASAPMIWRTGWVYKTLGWKGLAKWLFTLAFAIAAVVVLVDSVMDFVWFGALVLSTVNLIRIWDVAALAPPYKDQGEVTDG